MKAIVCEKYGSPDVLKLKEIEKPVPKDDEVLVKIYASSINSFDHRSMRANPFFIRFSGQGLLKPKYKILGADMAGKVEAVGKSVTLFEPGDEVYGEVAGHRAGGYAQYTCVSQNASIVIKPKNMTFEQAAAVPIAAMTALQGLRDKGDIKKGQTVLINGASGGVGTFAVLIAKAYGTQVTGVCGTRNVDLVKSLGADKVIDYKKENFKECGKQFDLIFDVAANCSIKDYRKLLKPGGTCIITGFSTIPHMAITTIKAARETKKGEYTIKHMGSAVPSKEVLEDLKTLMETGKMVPAIDRVYPLEKTADAMRYFEDEHAKAKVVIRIAKDA